MVGHTDDGRAAPTVVIRQAYTAAPMTLVRPRKTPSFQIRAVPCRSWFPRLGFARRVARLLRSGEAAALSPDDPRVISISKAGEWEGEKPGRRSNGGERVQVLGGAAAGRARARIPEPAAAGGADGGAAGVQVVGARRRRALLLAGDRHRGVEPAAAEPPGPARPHARAARPPQLRRLPPHQRLRPALRPALLLHRRPRARSEDAGDPAERDQRRRGGGGGAGAAQPHVPGHQQLHQDRRARAGGVRQPLPVPGGAPARDAPDRRGRAQRVRAARRGPRHRAHHAGAPPPGGRLHAGHHGGHPGGALPVPGPGVRRPPGLLGRRRGAAAGAAPAAQRPRPGGRRLLREQLLGGVLRRRRRRLLVGAHGRRRVRERRRRGGVGRRAGPRREPRGAVLRRRLQRELRRLRLASLAVTDSPGRSRSP